jgi:hypothetical protein
MVPAPDPDGSRGVPLSEPTIRVVRSTGRSTGTPQTPGLPREVALDGRRPDAMSAEEDTSCVVARSHPDPIVVDLPELDEFAGAPAVDDTAAE